ncbi:MAG: hypothetical protein RIB86_06915, partial [Imperialibacter sp.]
EIIGGWRNITPELAVRLEDALGIKAEFSMKYQVACEIDKTRIKNKKAVEKSIFQRKQRNLAKNKTILVPLLYLDLSN